MYYGLQSPPDNVLCIGFDDGKVTMTLSNGRVLPEPVARKLFNIREIRRMFGKSTGKLDLLSCFRNQQPDSSPLV